MSLRLSIANEPVESVRPSKIQLKRKYQTRRALQFLTSADFTAANDEEVKVNIFCDEADGS